MNEPIALGVDLGGTKIYSVAATAGGRILGDDYRPTEAAGGPQAVVERVVASLWEALSRSGCSMSDVTGAGISTPGPCDPSKGLVTDAPNLPGFHNVPLAKLVGEALGMPTVLENDANAACYGEHRFGAGRGFRHILYVTLGTGIGGGMMIDGKIYWGASGAAGEVGHIIIDQDGPPCNCGSRGCLEALASGPAIARAAEAAAAEGRSARLAELAAGGSLSAEQVHRAALQGDPAAKEVIERAGEQLGLGLTGLLNCFNPEALILGGGLLGMGDLYLGPALATARKLAFPQVVADATIVTAKLGESAGALGAAALMMDQAHR